jgi:tartrate dehydrogenase/decarboxylase/D-malate dehydrogenase
VHGSAPDIAGKGIANPIGQIWCAAMMLEFLGDAPGADRERFKSAADAIVRAIEQVCAHGPRTGDMGGKAGTVEVGKAIAEAI